jgi:hypothetical protein
MPKRMTTGGEAGSELFRIKLRSQSPKAVSCSEESVTIPRDKLIRHLKGGQYGASAATNRISVWDYFYEIWCDSP